MLTILNQRYVEKTSKGEGKIEEERKEYENEALHYSCDTTSVSRAQYREKRTVSCLLAKEKYRVGQLDHRPSTI